MAFQQLTSSQVSPEVPINETFAVLYAYGVYGYRADTSSGLTWGYYGGRWGGFSIAEDATLTLTGSTTNYIVVNKSTGASSVSTTSTNWGDLTNYARVYKLTTSVSAVTATEDHRAGPGGVTYGPDAGVGSAGKHAIYISAAGIVPSATGGCAALATIATSANQPDVTTLDFDAATTEYAQFSIVMPKSWDEGTVTFKAHWSHAATTTNFGAAWALQGVAVSNDDAIAAAYGTAVIVADTGGTTDDFYSTAESSAATIGGTPASEDMVFFRVYRKHDDAGDTMAIDARLHGITLFITTNAETDA